MRQSPRQGGRNVCGHCPPFFAPWPGWALAVAEFYRVKWWDRLGLARFPQAVADELFEQAVNLGRGGAGRLLQRLCNAFNYDRRTGAALFVDLAEDGVIGPKTLDALSTILTGRTDEAAVVHALNCLRARITSGWPRIPRPGADSWTGDGKRLSWLGSKNP